MYSENFRNRYDKTEDFKEKWWVFLEEWVYSNKDLVMYLASNFLKKEIEAPKWNKSLLEYWEQNWVTRQWASHQLKQWYAVTYLSGWEYNKFNLIKYIILKLRF